MSVTVTNLKTLSGHREYWKIFVERMCKCKTNKLHMSPNCKCIECF